jgi:hypothetical protein
MMLSSRSNLPAHLGSIYFLQVGADGPVKIGFTKSNVKYRVRTYQAGSPHALRWIGFFAGERSDERQAHLLLANSWHRAEWFHPTVEVLAFVRQKTAPDFIPVVAEIPTFPLVRRRKGIPIRWVLA